MKKKIPLRKRLLRALTDVVVCKIFYVTGLFFFGMSNWEGYILGTIGLMGFLLGVYHFICDIFGIAEWRYK